MINTETQLYCRFHMVIINVWSNEMNDIFSNYIAMFEFKVTAHYDLWKKIT